MPDYIPQSQLPQGLGQELLRMANNKPNPWADLAKSLGDSAGGVIADMGKRKAMELQQPTMQDIQNAMKMVQGGDQGQYIQNMNQRVKPSMVPFVEKLAESKMVTERMMGVQGLKGEQAGVKDHTVATSELLKNYPAISKMGFKEGMMVPNSFIKDQAKPSTGASDSALDSMAKDIASGKLYPAQIPEVLGRGGPGDRAKLWEKLKKIDPNFDAGIADTFYKSNLSMMQSKGRTTGNLGHVLAAASDVVEKNLGRIEQLLNEIPTSDIKIVNTAFRKFETEIEGNPKAQELLTHLIEAREQQAVVLANGHAATETDKRGAMNMFSDGISRGSFAGTHKAVSFNNINKVKAFQNQNLESEMIKEGDKNSSGKEEKKVSADDYLKSHGL